MGTMVAASCKCGFRQDIVVGGGMDDYTTTCWFPCLCENCNHIVQVNMHEEQILCPECGKTGPIPYSDPRLIGIPGTRREASWYLDLTSERELVLTNGYYLCPSCRQFELQFMSSGCFD